MARFPAQPKGPGPFCRDAAFLAGSFSQLNFAARALPRGKTGSGAVVLKHQQTLREQIAAIVELNESWLLIGIHTSTGVRQWKIVIDSLSSSYSPPYAPPSVGLARTAASFFP
ncbi:hypothetical protein DNK06_21240 [Pseudomonas daroniae]|uniref:Uncharacterized protein n=1 Tax=Phytopseudomonas daroniae TaxID=2487519 RepID=A0A4Q9QGM4_9GAMM|nr:hypothetical protein DNK06_21240 [Pseudomonas daroniae]TBU77773.1 hypothetical protein DNK31_21490 [Pseudomonas sp. FRB 228]TBU87735.1 hypothetical protein DNJ99_21370 [Pseudomonas daroniae]